LLTANSLSQAELMVGQTITSTDGKSSGAVTSVTVSSSGATATLANGDQVDLSTGATIQ
jgi:flagellar basal-body rod modification protein FlgD